MLEERLIEIEMKLTRQEDLLDALNQGIYRQQKQIDELQALCAALAARLSERSDDGSNRQLPHEPPPHY